MATDYTAGVDSDKFAQNLQFGGIGKGFGENISGLIVGSNVADMDTLRSDTSSEPMQVHTVSTS